MKIKLLLFGISKSHAEEINELLNSSNEENFTILVENDFDRLNQRLKGENFDLVFLGVSTTLLEELKKIHRLMHDHAEIPFIALLQDKDEHIGQNLVMHGAQDFLLLSAMNKSILQKSIVYSIDRKLSEGELRKSEQKYRDLFHRSKDAIYISTLSGEFIDLNPAGLNLFGYDMGDLVSLTVNDLYLNPSDRDILVQELNENGQIENYEILLIKKDRRTVLSCLLNTTVILDHNNQMIGFQGIIKDITAKKNAEEALFRSLRDLDQANKELQFLNVTLEQKVIERTAELQNKMNIVNNQNKEITESINYAKRIQASILPPIRKVKDQLPNSFIFYQPKDIVSGDFYWFENTEDLSFLAVVDCTGHGVPGAFMSIIGYTQLNEIINDQKTTDLAHVLGELDQRVIMALNREGNDQNSKDGMELGLISYNKKTETLNFAGAMRPLYLIQNNVLNVIKGDKFPIGGHSYRKKTFTSHEIKINKGDVVYLFSDGYPDQFGGPNRKKFMTRNVSDMIKNISHLNMEEQEMIVKNAINNWMANEEQIDDILFTGIKF